jgi:membrane protein DedA with SNARE-associated domain
MESMAGEFEGFLRDSRLVHVALFIASLIDATGLPFPGRVILISAGAMAGSGWAHVFGLIVAGALGAVAGDHVWYAAGRFGGGDRLMALYCKLSLASSRCERRARDRFERFGPFAIVIGRFFAGVRMVSTPAASQVMAYPKFLLFELAGGLIWSGTFVLLGWFLGAQWRALMERYGVGTIIIAVVGITIVGAAAIIIVRLMRRSRHGRPSFPPREAQM